jgi:RNA-directed DNA polymerase
LVFSECRRRLGVYKCEARSVASDDPILEVAGNDFPKFFPCGDGTGRACELQRTVRTQSREAVSQAQDRIRGAVTRDKKEKLTALLHHVTVDVLRRAFFRLKRRAAPGVDGVTWEDYAADLDRNLTDLHARVHRGAYRALPSRRRYIPKADGKQRPLGIAAIEDKIVQAAVVAILTPIYEAEFLGFSYVPARA